jgi:methenyltetrahydromethanopterin cyclohydrolase
VSEKQPEALRLACIFEDSAEAMGSTSDDYFYKAAAELRRQHALLKKMAGASRGLLDALPSATEHPAIAAMRAALAKWEASK